MAKYKLEKGQKFLACVWVNNPNHVTKTKGFKELDAARRWTKRILENQEYTEVGILTKDKRNKSWPWVQVERHQNPTHERMREAAKRVAAEERSKKRR